jgi:4-amino-4-deoxychorismate lyase
MFVETIKIQDNKIINLELHNKRLNNTIKNNFNTNSEINLKDYIKIDNINNKIRVLYSNKIEDIQYSRIEKREFKKFKIIYDNNINYKYKSTNRQIFNKYLNKEKYDDIIIMKNALATDTSISNIYFLQDKIWYTPRKPLLKGTMREELLTNRHFKQIDIDLNFIKSCDKMAISNALIGFYICEDYEII